MNNKMKSIVLYIIFPLILIVVGFFLSIYFYRETSLLTLQFSHPNEHVSYPATQELLKGELIQGELIAQENNLGTIAIPVTTFNRINNDIVVFELRQKGEKDWQVFNKYFTDRFPNDEPYPFGFPPIVDSKGKTFEFIVYSVNGVADNAIGFMHTSYNFYSRYTFLRSDFVSRTQLISFFKRKLLNLFSNVGYILYTLLFLLPTAFYFLFLNNNILSRKRITGFTLIAIILTLYIVAPVLMKSDVIWFVAFLISCIAWLSKMRSRHVFGIALVLLITSPVWLLFPSTVEVTNRSAITVFFVSIIGILLLYCERT